MFGILLLKFNRILILFKNIFLRLGKSNILLFILNRKYKDNYLI